MIDIPKTYESDGFLFEHVYTDTADRLEYVNEKMIAAARIRLKTLVVPLMVNRYVHGDEKFELHFYKYTRLTKEVRDFMKKEESK